MRNFQLDLVHETNSRWEQGHVNLNWKNKSKAYKTEPHPCNRLPHPFCSFAIYILFFFTAAAVHLQDSAPFLRVRFSGNCAAQLQRILALGILNFLISFSPLTWPGQLPRRGHIGRRSRDLTTFQIKTHLMRNKRKTATSASLSKQKDIRRMRRLDLCRNPFCI